MVHYLSHIFVILTIKLIATSVGYQQRFNETTLQMGLFGCNLQTYCSVTADQPLHVSTNMSCCSPCSCTRDCWFFGDCCPDVEEGTFTPPFRNITFNCEGNSLFGNSSDHTSYFKMASKCPADYDDITTKQLCEVPLESGFSKFNVSLQDIVTVSSSDGFAFRNVHCAACNDVFEVTRWNVIALECQQSLYTVAYFDLQSVIDTCKLVTEPPDGSRAERTRCYNEAISTCNQEREKHFNDDVEKACDFSKSPVTYKVGLNTFLYFNIFCLMCSRLHYTSLNLPVLCDDDPHSKAPTHYGLYVLLDITVLTTTDVLPINNKCSRDQIYDDFMGTCRKLVCPFTRKPKNGECIESGYQWHATAVQFPISVTHNNDDMQANSMAMKYVAIGFLDVVGLSTICRACVVGGLYKHERTLVSNIAIELNSMCTFEKIATSIVPVKTSNITVELKINMNYQTNVTLTVFPVFDSTVYTFIFQPIKSPCPITLSGFKLNKLFDCPYVVLNETEYCSWVNKDIGHNNSSCKVPSAEKFQNSSVIEIFNENDIFQFGICISAYFKDQSYSLGNRLDCMHTSSFLAYLLMYVYIG